MTVNADQYTEMINNFFTHEPRRKRLPIRRVWFQQDGATVHTAKVSTDVIRPLFGDHLISRFAATPWPPWSQDLSICDYFLLRYFKARVYEHKSRTLEDLKEAIRVELAQID